MKRILLMFCLVLGMGSMLFGQKFAYVDTKYILDHIPEYFEAKATLNKLSSDWQGEIERKYESINRLEKAFAAEKVLLTEDMKRKREDEIAAKRDEAREMQKQKFGVGGDLFKQREELIQPIQDRIYDSLLELAESGGYMVIFDKSQGGNMLYSNPKYDISDKVIKKMGYTPGETLDNQEGENENAPNSPPVQPR